MSYPTRYRPGSGGGIVAKIDEKVMAAVEKALKKNPDASVDELQEVGKKVNPAVSRLTKRQFHARYPLQVKRKMNPPKRRRSRKKKSRRKGNSADGAAREAVRGTFLEFASDLAAAEARKDVVRVVANVDSYVDKVLKATSN